MVYSQFKIVDRETSLASLSPEQWHSGCVIAFDKPMDWSSFDVIKYVRQSVPVKKIGHAGTLDPKATGLLVCCTGKATKAISELQNTLKEYETVIRLGVTSPSLDIGTEDTVTSEWRSVPKEAIEQLLEQEFIGEIEQLPPAFSALKVNGRRAYDLARKGIDPDLKSRKVYVESIKVMDISEPLLRLKIRCGKGTYIRAIARDLGLKLGTVARLETLRRTQSGFMHVDRAWDPKEFRSQMNQLNYD